MRRRAAGGEDFLPGAGVAVHKRAGGAADAGLGVLAAGALTALALPALLIAGAGAASTVPALNPGWRGFRRAGPFAFPCCFG